MAEFRIETERLVLREWREEDLVPLHAMSNDPAVMEYLGPLQSIEEVTSAVERQRAYQTELGHCYWVIERRDNVEMIGFCGIQPEPATIPAIGGLPDIGWRLASNMWGQGFAREAAIASLDWAFANLKDDKIWAITVANNRRSWGLMERLGMVRHYDLDFDHPNVPDGSPLKAHITYSIGRDAWRPHH
jgi:RimJ/RimL family protein N-acetyltransferase